MTSSRDGRRATGIAAGTTVSSPPAWPWLRRAWRALPEPWRRKLTPGVEHLQQWQWQQRLRQRWQRGFPPGSGVAVVGCHGAVLGLGEGARLQARVWQADGMDVETVDVSALIDAAEPALPRPSPGRTVVSHLNPPELLRYLALTDGQAIAGRRHIGYWAWELPQPPASWRRAFALVDEVWVPSRYVADALARLPGPRSPIRVVPHPVHRLPVSSPPRPVDPAALLAVLVAMDLRSSLARKNFTGVVALARAVHARLPGRVTLCLKLSGAGAEPAVLRQCRDDVADLPDLRLLDDDLPDALMAGLIDACDVIVSLHRAEGFGLLLAHGMHAGKLVIATGWSGNREFMAPDATVCLRSTLVPVRDPSGRYAGSMWAEPDLDQALAAIERAVADPAWRRRLAARAPGRLAAALGGRQWLDDTRCWLAGSTARPRPSAVQA